jgi:hypothetical protein
MLLYADWCVRKISSSILSRNHPCNTLCVFSYEEISKEKTMTNKKSFSGMLTIVLVFVFGLILAGCTTTTGGAEPSAADINAVKPGSAEVQGGTVTLTGGVRLENATLTVPEGVILDLTQEGAVLELQDGAVLTVNGTVNAKSQGINIDSVIANPAIINGSGTIQLKSKGRLLGIWEGRKLTLDGVTLVGLPDNSWMLVEVEDGGELVLKSGKISGNTIVSEDGTPGGGVTVNGESGVFTMTGGEISGNNAREAGGVAINSGSFIMEDGIILGNTGLYMGGVSIGHGATFIMEGGAIFGNTAEDFGGVGIVNGTFTLKGGRIQGSTDSDGFAKNTGNNSAALRVMNNSTAKWSTSGAYTKGGVSQTGGSDIGGTSDTLIAASGK